MKACLFLALALTAFVVVDAGFCDSKRYNGYYCDDDDRKYCSCKRKKGTTKCDKTYEQACKYGCSSGKCGLPPTPPPADEVCATVAVPSVYYAQCPMVKDPYRLWKNYQDNANLLNTLYDDAKADFEWWDDLRVQMVSVNDTLREDMGLPELNLTNIAEVKAVSKITAAWIGGNCDTDNRDYSCRYAFPECKANKGVTAACMKTCTAMDKCVADIYAACKATNAADYNGTLVCSSYKDLYPGYVGSDGKRFCSKFCTERQNDYKGNSASYGAPAFVSILVLQLLAVWFK